eukprot:Rhum_TRINITY_DN2751_c0_g1::Rhum_TRINITY_DN2751_c0_g1_i1::g.8124::m.8124
MRDRVVSLHNGWGGRGRGTRRAQQAHECDALPVHDPQTGRLLSSLQQPQPRRRLRLLRLRHRRKVRAALLRPAAAQRHGRLLREGEDNDADAAAARPSHILHRLHGGAVDAQQRASRVRAGPAGVGGAAGSDSTENERELLCKLEAEGLPWQACGDHDGVARRLPCRLLALGRCLRPHLRRRRRLGGRRQPRGRRRRRRRWRWRRLVNRRLCRLRPRQRCRLRRRHVAWRHRRLLGLEKQAFALLHCCEDALHTLVDRKPAAAKGGRRSRGCGSSREGGGRGGGGGGSCWRLRPRTRRRWLRPCVQRNRHSRRRDRRCRDRRRRDRQVRSRRGSRGGGRRRRRRWRRRRRNRGRKLPLG